MPKQIQPNFVLDVEKSELSIQAGLQDRVVQVYTYLYVVVCMGSYDWLVANFQSFIDFLFTSDFHFSIELVLILKNQALCKFCMHAGIINCTKAL